MRLTIIRTNRAKTPPGTSQGKGSVEVCPTVGGDRVGFGGSVGAEIGVAEGDKVGEGVNVGVGVAVASGAWADSASASRVCSSRNSVARVGEAGAVIAILADSSEGASC
jgi:hypothetical protein